MNVLRSSIGTIIRAQKLVGDDFWATRSSSQRVYGLHTLYDLAPIESESEFGSQFA